GVAMAAVISTAAAAQTGPVNFDIASGDLGQALGAYAKQSGVELFYQSRIVQGRSTQGLHGAYAPREGLDQLLKGTGLVLAMDQSGIMVVRNAADPQSGSAAGDGADAGTVAALVVTAQKKEENIQDVPIAISAFTEKSLEEQKIEGGFDLLKAIPNVTFSKNNFTSYNFSIRGIGTKAVSATTDPGVAVSFNNVSLIQNRLFEQEYFDVERVEVLRGPQGTLYGRNATAGVINVISAKPNLQDFSGWIKGEVGNYHAKRLSAMVNVPLVQDKLGVRLAGALTDRAGYDYNSVTKHAVNGRDLWSGRITVAFNPTDNIRSNLVWERFNEDDNRSRTGKQLCHHDDGRPMVGSTPVSGWWGSGYTDAYARQYISTVDPVRRALFSQGCRPGSLYDPLAFGTPNGMALPFVAGLFMSPLPFASTADGQAAYLLQIGDPYGGMMQSPDLRTIASFRDPVYRAKADVVELNIDVDLPGNFTISSQTAYDKDTVYSFQDYNRFNTRPVFNDTSLLYDLADCGGYNCLKLGASPWAKLAPGGIFCDPQLGCSNTLAGFDISQAKATQFTTELRLASHSEGPINFSAGANYTRFNVLADYYVFYNLVSAMAMTLPFNMGSDRTQCGFSDYELYDPTPVSMDSPDLHCVYVDPNPIESINGEGHNYFRSKNPYKLRSAAAFGELYWQVNPAVKLTAGLRYNDDRKTFIPVPSQVLLAASDWTGGYVSRGYPELPPIKQHWGEWTGRLGVDWKPDVSFTDETMLYAFYSRGYKGGGANPPRPGFANAQQAYDMASQDPLLTPEVLEWMVQSNYFPTIPYRSAEYADTFRPEFVNAFEVGAKNVFFGGAMTLNGDAFFYDYTDYQVSQIRDRTAVNENFDAKVWGLEFETTFAPSRNLRLIANLGYLDTAIGNGMTSIDTMNRTQSNPNYVVVKPWPQLPSNCVVPAKVVEEGFLLTNPGINYSWGICGGLGGFLGVWGWVIDPATGAKYDPMAVGPDGKLLYPEINGGAGLKADLGGNELPNSPHWTGNVAAQYSYDVLGGSWRATIRADGYWQSQSWARVYNAVNDKLHGWYNANLSLWLERPEDGLKIEIYAKNVLDKTPITDAFLNSDDSALTTNVFTLDPRLIGLSIKKGF
ncbi:MAG: TonB-dependent receptor domain-containing protein, partial [Parcubacteria group bacterium]